MSRGVTRAEQHWSDEGAGSRSTIVIWKDGAIRRLPELAIGASLELRHKQIGRGKQD